MKLDFSAGIGRNENVHQLVKLSKVAEESGFSHLTIVDQPILSRDVFVAMTLAALNTNRIQIGQGVTDPLTFHPSVLANATATVDELSGGRAFLGMGAGGAFGKMMRPVSMAFLKEAILFVKMYTSGKEGEFRGAKMHSEWIRKPLPVYLACIGPRSCELAGEVADGAIIGGTIVPETVKWKLELIQKGALKADRDPSGIDVWMRTLIYVSKSKEAARREVAGYAITKAYSFYDILRQNTASSAFLRDAVERFKPGVIEDLRRVHKAFDQYQHEMTDAPINQLATQSVIDLFLMTGSVEDICEQINTLGELGVNNISSVFFTVIDKAGMMQEIGDKIMPNFRN